jgi:hypothetical protein
LEQVIEAESGYQQGKASRYDLYSFVALPTRSRFRH